MLDVHGVASVTGNSERAGGNFIFADGGVRNGIDVLKMRWGQCCINRTSTIWGAVGGGSEGVRQMVAMTEQLRHGMLMTGCVNLKLLPCHLLMEGKQKKCRIPEKGLSQGSEKEPKCIRRYAGAVFPVGDVLFLKAIG